MTTLAPRQFRFPRLFLGLAFAALGVWSLADARYPMGAFYLAIAAAWLVMGAFQWSRSRDLKSQDDT